MTNHSSVHGMFQQILRFIMNASGLTGEQVACEAASPHARWPLLSHEILARKS
jgi:hypothetical protein